MSPFERLLAIMTKPSVVIIYFIWAVLSFFYFDKPLAYYFQSVDLRANLLLLSWITKFGLGAIYLPSFLLLALFFRYMHKNAEWEARAWFLFLCVAIPVAICVFLKVILGRARPSLLFDGNLYGFYGFQMNAHFWSFPSGHTTTIIGVVLGLSIVFPRYFKALILTGLAVAFSRVLLTHHFLSDVMIAAYLTLIEVGVILCVLRRKSWLMPAWSPVT